MSEECAPVGPPRSKVDNVVLEKFEALVYRRMLNEASAELLLILNRLRAGAEFVGYSMDDAEEKQVLYTRLAAAIVSLIASPHFNLSEDGFVKLGVQHAMLSAIFEVSAFGNADFAITGLLDNPVERDPRKFKFSDPRNMAKFLLLHSHNSNIDLNLDELFSKASRTALPVFLGMLTHTCVMTPLSNDRREKLLGMGHHFIQERMIAQMLPAMSDAFMFTSYGVRKDKHEIKRHFQTMMARLFSNVPKMPKNRHKTKPHPTIVIPLEWFNSFHAMFRCYAPSVRQLRGHFKLIAFARKSDLDQTAIDLFDEVVSLDDNVVLDELVKQIHKRQPDIIWYPSIGMALYWVALSSIRLAPIQLMTLGHPASSMSSAIDYVLTEEGQVGDPKCCREKIITLPSGAWQFEERSDTIIPPSNTGNDGVIRIAVPANVFKLNLPFLECLRRIDENSEHKIEYHFFPNVMGLTYWQTCKRLKHMFPTCSIYKRDDYPSYLNNLAKCNLHFCSFPFGNTNGNIDSMLVGLPLLCLDGSEPHETYDGLMLRKVGLDDCIAHSVEEYEAIAHTMISSNGMRQSCKQTLKNSDIRRIFFGERTDNAKNAVLNAFWNIYKNHEELRGEKDGIHDTRQE